MDKELLRRSSRNIKNKSNQDSDDELESVKSYKIKNNKINKKDRNKEAASRYRLRQKREFLNMELQILQLKKENLELKNKINSYEECSNIIYNNYN